MQEESASVAAMGAAEVKPSAAAAQEQPAAADPSFLASVTASAKVGCCGLNPSGAGCDPLWCKLHPC